MGRRYGRGAQGVHVCSAHRPPCEKRCNALSISRARLGAARLSHLSRPPARGAAQASAGQKRRTLGRVRLLARCPARHGCCPLCCFTLARAQREKRSGRTDGPRGLSPLSSSRSSLPLFNSDTSKIVLRVLTARSAQRVLAQLGDTDLFVQKWFNDFLSENPPLKGDPFIQALFKERAVYMKDSVTGMEHFVSPAQLAHRILAMRELMARTVTAGFPEMVTRTNVDVLRQHLESSSYTSGTTSNTPAGGGGAADKGGRGRGGR